MADRTSIEWTRGLDGSPGATWNPIRARNRVTGAIGWHCEHASPGCLKCYSETFNRDRLGTRLPFKPGHLGDVEIFLDEAMLTQPLRWRRPRSIFVCSMTDLFGAFVPDAMIDRVFAVMALAPQHTFQVLTKRSARMRAYMTDLKASDRVINAAHGLTGQFLIGDGPLLPLPNVWLGVSTEDQRRADERVPDLLATPASVRFVSAEPLLSDIDFTPWLYEQWGRPGTCFDADGQPWHAPGSCPYCRPRLDQIIVGGESGPGARPMHPSWARDIRDQCAAAGVAFFFKQWGDYEVAIDRDRDDPDWRADYSRRFGNEGATRWVNLAGGQGFHGEAFHVMRRVGKARAGRLLDGVEHDGMPEGRP